MVGAWIYGGVRDTWWVKGYIVCSGIYSGFRDIKHGFRDIWWVQGL